MFSKKKNTEPLGLTNSLSYRQCTCAVYPIVYGNAVEFDIYVQHLRNNNCRMIKIFFTNSVNDRIGECKLCSLPR